MNLHSLLHHHRRRPEPPPPLPLIEPDEHLLAEPAATPPASPRTLPLTDEERLERLPTPTELELVLDYRMSQDPDPAPPPRHDAAAP